MSTGVLIAVAAAGVSAMLAWREATRVDRLSLHAGASNARREQRARRIALGALLTAVAATTCVQFALLGR